jgi:hypothetical protein
MNHNIPRRHLDVGPASGHLCTAHVRHGTLSYTRNKNHDTESIELLDTTHSNGCSHSTELHDMLRYAIYANQVAGMPVTDDGRTDVEGRLIREIQHGMMEVMDGIIRSDACEMTIIPPSRR